MVLQQPAPEKYQVGQAVVRAGDYDIPVEVADTDTERTKGLSGRTTLEGGHGLLFSFDKPGLYGFWMKDMQFPIDIIWIDDKWTAVGVEKGARPNSFPQIFYPAREVRYVLEMNAGEAERFSIAPGTKLDFGYRK